MWLSFQNRWVKIPNSMPVKPMKDCCKSPVNRFIFHNFIKLQLSVLQDFEMAMISLKYQKLALHTYSIAGTQNLFSLCVIFCLNCCTWIYIDTWVIQFFDEFPRTIRKVISVNQVIWIINFCIWVEPLWPIGQWLILLMFYPNGTWRLKHK